MAYICNMVVVDVLVLYPFCTIVSIVINHIVLVAQSWALSMVELILKYSLSGCSSSLLTAVFNGLIFLFSNGETKQKQFVFLEPLGNT